MLKFISQLKKILTCRSLTIYLIRDVSKYYKNIYIDDYTYLLINDTSFFDRN